MFEKMLVAFDGSDTGVDGLVLSMGLAKAFGSTVAVVYVYDEELSASSREAARELALHADAVLAGAREHVSQALAVTFCALPSSSPARGLHELARSEEAELIAVRLETAGSAHEGGARGGQRKRFAGGALCGRRCAPRLSQRGRVRAAASRGRVDPDRRGRSGARGFLSDRPRHRGKRRSRCDDIGERHGPEP